MGYTDNQYNGIVRVGTVKWSNDYKHIMRFEDSDGHRSKAKRNEFIENHLTLLSNKISFIPNPNGYIDVYGNLKNKENLNYLCYKNSSDISDGWYCCFITDYELIAGYTTRLHLELDVFQQYYYDTTFYKCLLERAHISKTEDNNNWYKYTAPEPIGAEAEINENTTAFNDIDFTPKLVLDTISKPDNPPASTRIQYYWGGNGDTQSNLTGYFRFRCPSSASTLSTAMYLWGLSETDDTTITHYNDLIGFSFLPEWVINSSSWSLYTNLGANIYELNNNNLVEISDTVSINHGALACGYTPTNKKMYTNLARAFKLWTENGLCIPLAPNSLGNRNSITIRLSMRPMGSTYKVRINDYKDVSKRFFDLQYSYNIALGLNANTGTAQQTALQNLNNQTAVLKASQKEQAVSQAVGVGTSFLNSAISFGAGALSGGGALKNMLSSGVQNMGGAGGLLSGIGQLITAPYSLDRIGKQMDADNFNMQTAINDAVNSIGASIGNNSDRTTMTNAFCRLRLADCSPTAENCRIIDDFLTIYGYSIQEIKNPSDYIMTRPQFNYLKTSNCNLSVPAPANYEKVLKNIFNSGCFIWHKYNNFGNLDIQNW